MSKPKPLLPSTPLRQTRDKAQAARQKAPVTLESLFEHIEQKGATQEFTGRVDLAHGKSGSPGQGQHLGVVGGLFDDLFEGSLGFGRPRSVRPSRA